MSFIFFEKSLLINDSSDSECQRHSDQCLISGEASINGVVVTWVVAMMIEFRPAGGSIPS